MKFYFVGLIVFLVAAVGIVAMLITTCRRDTVRMTVNSAEIQKANGEYSQREGSTVGLQMTGRVSKSSFYSEKGGGGDTVEKQFHPQEVDIFNSSSQKFNNKVNQDMMVNTKDAFYHSASKFNMSARRSEIISRGSSRQSRMSSRSSKSNRSNRSSGKKMDTPTHTTPKRIEEPIEEEDEQY